MGRGEGMGSRGTPPTINPLLSGVRPFPTLSVSPSVFHYRRAVCDPEARPGASKLGCF